MPKLKIQIGFCIAMMLLNFVFFAFLAGSVRLHGNETKYGLPAFAIETVDLNESGSIKSKFEAKPLAVAVLYSIAFIAGLLSQKYSERERCEPGMQADVKTRIKRLEMPICKICPLFQALGFKTDPPAP